MSHFTRADSTYTATATIIARIAETRRCRRRLDAAQAG